MKVMITGGFGFIGTNLVQYWHEKYPQDEIIVVDSITYAADPHPIRSMKSHRIKEAMIDIRDQAMVARVLRLYEPDIIFHLAAESHVCRSIAGPKDFITTNIVGTWHLLEEWKALYNCNKNRRFIHVSTDEVFGELHLHDAPFHEDSQVKPRSPYAASKASSDLIALAYYETYGLPVIVTNCSNNYGRHQHEEKLIPATITRILQGKNPLLLGDGKQIRDWLFVEDHCRALDTIASTGFIGQRYCIGGEMELTNKAVVELIYMLIQDLCPDLNLHHKVVIEYDQAARPTDDRRYAIDCTKLWNLGWKPSRDFRTNLQYTIEHYIMKNITRVVCPETSELNHLQNLMAPSWSQGTSLKTCEEASPSFQEMT